MKGGVAGAGDLTTPHPGPLEPEFETPEEEKGLSGLAKEREELYSLTPMEQLASR